MSAPFCSHDHGQQTPDYETDPKFATSENTSSSPHVENGHIGIDSPPTSPLPGHEMSDPSAILNSAFNRDNIEVVKLLIEAESQAEDYPRQLLDIMTDLYGDLQDELVEEVLVDDSTEGRPPVVDMLCLLGLVIEGYKRLMIEGNAGY